jgi:hypothetical protein
VSSALERRRFSRSEVEQIVRRAAELQETSHDGRIEHGASLSEIEQLAARVGLDPAHVRAATRELYQKVRPGLGQRFLGGPTQPRLRRVIPRALSDAQLETLLHAIQRETGAIGNVSTVGHTIIWTSGAGQALRRSVSISSSGGETTILMDMNVGQLAGGLFGGIGGGVGGGLGINALVWAIIQHSAVLGAVAGGVFVGAYLVPRWIFGKVVGAWIAQGERLLDTLATQAAALP